MQSDCDKNWLVKLTASPAGTCSACPKQENNLLLFIAMIIVALAYMTFLVEDTLSGARQMIETKEPMPFHTIAIRIMSSYLQVAGMLLSFEITIPPAVQDLVDRCGAGEGSDAHRVTLFLDDHTKPLSCGRLESTAGDDDSVSRSRPRQLNRPSGLRGRGGDQ